MRRTWIHILLFVLTIASTWLTGGPGYSIAVILILLGHELGHYFVSRSYGMRATLPSFYPVPLFLPLGPWVRSSSWKAALHRGKPFSILGWQDL